MKSLFVIAIIVLSTASARADLFYKPAGHECDEKAEVSFSSMSALMTKPEKTMQNKGARQWDLWSFVVNGKKNRDRIVSCKTVHGRYKLSEGIYDIMIGALPCNVNLQGR